MKRFFCLFTAVTLLMGMCLGCKRKDIGDSAAFNGVPLETVLENLYREADLELPERSTTEITRENMSYYLGTEDVEFSEGLASEALINVVPYSLCLLRVPDADKAGETADIIAENANPNKWVCVSVSGEKVVTDHAGDVVILIMAEQSAALHSAFRRLAAG